MPDRAFEGEGSRGPNHTIIGPMLERARLPTLTLPALGASRLGRARDRSAAATPWRLSSLFLSGSGSELISSGGYHASKRAKGSATMADGSREICGCWASHSWNRRYWRLRSSIWARRFTCLFYSLVAGVVS